MFCSTNKSTWAENEFFADLIKRFDRANFEVALLTDVYVNGKQLDCVLLSSKGAFIYEHKNYSGAIRGSENGEWTLNKPSGESVIINPNRENPFQQTRGQRFALMNYLNDHFKEIFPESSPNIIDTSHIGARLVFTHLTSESHVEIPDKAKRWFDVLDPEDTIENFRTTSTGLLTFKKNNIERMVQLLSLREVIEPSEKPDQPNTFCPVCAYEAEAVQCEAISGEVTKVDGSIIIVNDGEHLHTVYDQRDGSNVNDLAIQDHVDDEVGNQSSEYKLIGAIHEQMVKNLDNFPLQINLIHLIRVNDRLTITPDSLVILLPSWTISVTAFTQLDFCQRQVITGNYALAPTNKYINRGIAVNKGFDKMMEPAKTLEDSITAAKNEINDSKIEFITSGAGAQEINSQIESEVGRLHEWKEQRQLNGEPRTEAFLISTELGLKGKLDLVLEDSESGEITDIIELKSSKPDWITGDVKDFHAIQVGAYALMAVTKQKKPLDLSDVSVLYSQAQNHVEKKVDINKELFARICHYRNLLLYSEFFDTLPDYSHPMENPNGCKACGQKHICMDLCRVTQFDHCNTVCFKHPENYEAPINCGMNSDFDSLYLTEFNQWREFLKYQKLFNYSKYAKILQMPEEKAVELGKLLPVHHRNTDVPVPGKYIYTFEYSENTSEFRKHDIVLLSEHRNISFSSVAVGFVIEFGRKECKVQLNETLNFDPRYIHPYHIDRGDNIGFIGLYNGHLANHRVAEKIYGQEFKDIELIHGPPGSGKTREINTRLKKHIVNGESVVVCTLTNRAIDEIYNGLQDEGIQEEVYRFGSTSRLEEIGQQLKTSYWDTDELKAEIQNKKVWLGTIHSAANEWMRDLPFQFNYAYLDEASQITTPQSMFPLSLADKWVLVGDHHQLPPIFPTAKEKDRAIEPPYESIFKQILDHLKSAGRAPELLPKQFRMNPQIFEYSRRKWYADQESAESTANKILKYGDEAWSKDKAIEILSPEKPTIWVDIDAQESENNKRNTLEANAIAVIVNKLVQYGINAEDIGIMAPFRMQVNAIKNAVEKELVEPSLLDTKLVVDTVDRFQGTGRKVILISMCSLNPDDNIMLEGSLRRFNVAATRAECKRIIFGNVTAYKTSKIQDLFKDGYTEIVTMPN